MNSLLKKKKEVCLDNKFSTISTAKTQSEGLCVCVVLMADVSEYIFDAPRRCFPPRYAASGTRETNGPGLSKASGLLLSSTITSNVLSSIASSAKDNGVFEDEGNAQTKRVGGDAVYLMTEDGTIRGETMEIFERV